MSELGEKTELVLKDWKAAYRKVMWDHDCADTELKTDPECTVAGNSFGAVCDAFLNHEPIRNTNWAAGCYAILDADNRHITMYYEDDDPKLDHTTRMHCFSAADLASRNWIPIFATRRSLEEEFNDAT